MKNNIPAFPHPRIVLTGKDRELIINPSEGMSLRDFFAAKAMQSMIINPDVFKFTRDSTLSKQAYSIADAMLSEREK